MNEQMKIKVACPVAGEVWWDLLRIGVENKLAGKPLRGLSSLDIHEPSREITIKADGTDYGGADAWFVFEEDEDFHEHLAVEFGEHLRAVPRGSFQGEVRTLMSADDLAEWLSYGEFFGAMWEGVRECEENFGYCGSKKSKDYWEMFQDYIRTYRHNEDGSWTDGRDWNIQVEEWFSETQMDAFQQMAVSFRQKTDAQGLWEAPEFLTECGWEDEEAALFQIIGDAVHLLYSEAVYWMEANVEEGK
jgi:hypothetical protein